MDVPDGLVRGTEVRREDRIDHHSSSSLPTYEGNGVYGLCLAQLEKSPLLSSYERIYIAGFDRPPLLQNVDDVRASGSKQPVGDNQYRHAPVEHLYRALDTSFVL